MSTSENASLVENDPYSDTNSALGLSSPSSADVATQSTDRKYRSEEKERTYTKPKKKSKRQDLAGCRELYTNEFVKGDVPRKFVMHLPVGIKAGELIENIGGENMSVRLPDDIRPGEKVILIASYPRKKDLDTTTEEDTPCSEISCMSPGSLCRTS